MTRSARPWWLAVAGSLLLHAALFGGLNWPLPQWREPAELPAIEARLMPPAPVVALPVPANPASLPSRPKLAPLPAPATADVVETVLPEVAAADAMPALPDAIPIEMPEIEAAPVSQPVAEVEPPPLNALPPRLDLRFQVRYGLASGEQTLLWVNEGERYTVTSVVGATGLTGMLYRGRFVQTSRGRVTPRGLVPEEFWDQRGNSRSSARFDAASGTLTLSPAKGSPRHFSYQGAIQDALSLFFQFALTAPPPAGHLVYTVFSGKKLRDYTYEVRGEETLETALGALRTLHLVRVADGDDRFEAWLAIDRHYLPVRMLYSDEKGNEVQLRVQSIAP